MRFSEAYKELARLGLPILIGQLGMIIVGFADNIMVGHYSTAALASASFVNNLFNVAIFCCIGFTYGLTPLVGALFAGEERRSIGSLTRVALWINILYCAVVILVMGAVYLNIDRLGQPAELLPLIRPYYLLYLAGMLPVAIFNVFGQWSYGINNTALPMWIILAANAFNIVGNYALIYGNLGCPELGLTGAGIATLSARCLCPLVIMAYFFFGRRFRGYREGFLASPSRPGDCRLVWRTSLPVSLQLSFESGSFTLAAVMVGWLGAVPLAAFQIVVIVGTLGFCVYYSLGSAITVKVANAAGSASATLMRRYAWAGYHMMLVLAAVASLTFVFAGKHLMMLFSDDPAVVSLALSLIAPLVLYQLGDATQITFAGALRGTARVMPMLWIAFVCYVAVGLPACYLLCFTWSMATYGVILSFSVSLFLAGALFLAFFLRVTSGRASVMKS